MSRVLVIACFLFALVRAGARTTEVTAVVDMTDEGRKVVHPDPAHPAYYLPIMSGFLEYGDVMANGEKHPPPEHVAQLVAGALARQGYLLAHPALAYNAKDEVVFADGTPVMVPPYPVPNSQLVINGPQAFPLTRDMVESKNGPYSLRHAGESDLHFQAKVQSRKFASPMLQVLRAWDPAHGPVMQRMPSLIVFIRWGDAHPGEVSRGLGSANPLPNLRMGMDAMLSLIAGDTFVSQAFSAINMRGAGMDDRMDMLVQRTEVDRFFVTVTAYDFRTLYLHHKAVLLWSAKMTIPSNGGAQLDPLLSVLVDAGEKHFGRELTHTEFSTVDLGKGRVIIGTPEVKEDKVSP